MPTTHEQRIALLAQLRDTCEKANANGGADKADREEIKAIEKELRSLPR